MEFSGNSSAPSSQAPRSPTDHYSSSPAPPLRSPVVPSPTSELRFRVQLSKTDAHILQPGELDLDKGHRAHTTSSSGTSRERSDDTQRPLDPVRGDRTKKRRINDEIVGGSISECNKKLVITGEKTIVRKGFGYERGEGHDQSLKGSSSCLQAEHHDDLSAAKKAEKSFDRGAQKSSDREKLVARVGTRLPHKKAFKTMRSLTEVRDFIVEKPELELLPSAYSREALERGPPSQSLKGLDDGKHIQAKGALKECSGDCRDFPFTIPSTLKRARSSRERRGHKKLATEKMQVEDGVMKVEEARGLGVSGIGVEINCRDLDRQEIVQGEEDADASIREADATSGLPTCVEKGNFKDELAACPFAVRVERKEVGESRGEDRWQTEGTCTGKSNDGEQQEVHCRKESGINAEMSANMNCSAPKETMVGLNVCERMRQQQASALGNQEKAPRVLGDQVGGKRACYQSSERVQDVLAAGRASGQRDIDKERDASKDLLITLFSNSADVSGKHMKALTMMENSEQLMCTPRLQASSTCHDVIDNMAGKVDGYVSQCLTQKASRLGTFQLSLAPPGTPKAEAGCASNAHNGLMAPASTLQLPAHSHLQFQTHTQSQPQTFSEVYTYSIPPSRSLLHNSSCSLNSFSMENQELSCGGSRHESQGNEDISQRGRPDATANDNDSFFNLAQDKSKQGQRVPLYQWAIQNAQSSRLHKNIPTGQEALMSLNSNRHYLEGTARQGTKLEDILGRSFQQEEGAQHVAYTDRGALSKPLAQVHKVHDPASSSGAKSKSARGHENKLGGTFGLREIATQPVALMAHMMQELPDSFLESLRSLTRDLLRSFEKRAEFLTLQSIIKSRTDLTENALLHAQRTQLEILVALKTGEQAFVQVGAKPLTYKVLTEILLQTRCRNVACQQSLPVDGCECKLCSQKGGFCHECMCVVCSKFDSDNHTCRWVGCDVCMHWCHADCGLRMLHIAPAHSNKGASGNTEMQYRCITCGHNAELFGFVKNVFHLSAQNWGADTFTKELDCVRRIFHGSKDARGRQLCRKVEVLLQQLDMKVDTADIRRNILQYFDEGNSSGGAGCTMANKQSTSMQIDEPLIDGKVMVMQEAATEVAPKAENKVADDKKSRQSCETEFFAKEIKNIAELRIGQAGKHTEIDNIQSMVRLKQAEAKMLQQCADEAHQQAMGLEKVIIVKRDTFEDDYMCKYAKLRLNEAEEKRSKRLLELQALERAHLDYQNMKFRMEAQIKELAMKMGRASWQYA